MNLIFIFSLPRSGSTILEKILSNHSDITSNGETWILFNFIQNEDLKQYSNFSHKSLRKANEINLNNAKKSKKYYSDLNFFLTNIYQQISENKSSVYFLDKTPRYYYIIDEIAKVFPESKFIFLTRNPINVLISSLQVWGKGGYSKFYSYSNDYNYGPKMLAHAIKKYGKNTVTISYSDLTNDPEESLRRIMLYLGLNFDKNILNIAGQKPNSSFGDPNSKNGFLNIQKIDEEQKINDFINNSFRKKQLLKYAQYISNETYSALGYEKANIVSYIKNTSPKFNLIQNIIDFFHYYLGKLIGVFHLNLIFKEKEKHYLN